MDNKRDSFIFYRSFYDCMDGLSTDQKAQLFEAICNYSLDFKEPKLEGMAKSLFILMKPNLEANNKRFKNGNKGAEHGKKGGRPKPQANPKITPKKPLIRIRM